jgi:hypothetical protein
LCNVMNANSLLNNGLPFVIFAPLSSS